MREYILKLRYKVWPGQMFYHWALANGWHCGHWHSSFEDACGCLLEHTYDA